MSVIGCVPFFLGGICVRITPHDPVYPSHPSYQSPAYGIGAVNEFGTHRTTIQNLFDELLAMVFMHLSESSSDTSWINVIRVCRRWRRIALGISSFAARHVLDIPKIGAIEMALKYSRSKPKWLHTRGQWSYPRDDVTGASVLRLITPYLRNVQSIDIALPHSLDVSGIDLLGRLSSCRLDALESLSLSFPSYQYTIPHFGAGSEDPSTPSLCISAPSLRNIRYSKIHMPWNSHSLTHLELIGSSELVMPHPMSLNGLIITLASSPQLESLVLSGWSFSTPAAGVGTPNIAVHPTASLPCLNSLALTRLGIDAIVFLLHNLDFPSTVRASLFAIPLDSMDSVRAVAGMNKLVHKIKSKLTLSSATTLYIEDRSVERKFLEHFTVILADERSGIDSHQDSALLSITVRTLVGFGTWLFKTDLVESLIQEAVIKHVAVAARGDASSFDYYDSRNRERWQSVLAVVPEDTETLEICGDSKPYVLGGLLSAMNPWVLIGLKTIIFDELPLPRSGGLRGPLSVLPELESMLALRKRYGCEVWNVEIQRVSLWGRIYEGRLAWLDDGDEMRLKLLDYVASLV
ncbi:hypothetical protein K488DRAFT_74348 [Vararia minispora EC-137]|uniref:Uncharacterized protein n=1 Tax=Vararia minispora EC-137 TaxID=1314806 RepID=A0ACB8Q7M5_9AGAM|nr:hypothetical protein K488DRAFT_74348 [Vararia minispora EC-137]